ncbi:MAG: biotin/lipoyl-binding protein, partial [Halieaceae bacterium]|nr:biotin/lipoyl-binding protein [Halieaceae bacterium]
AVTPAPAAGAPAPGGEAAVYTVKVDGQSYVVEVAEGGEVAAVTPTPAAAPAPPGPAAKPGHTLAAPLAGNIFHVNVAVGDEVETGDVIIVLEAMKMETEVRSQHAGKVAEVMVKVGDKVVVGDPLISVA